MRRVAEIAWPGPTQRQLEQQGRRRYRGVIGAEIFGVVQQPVVNPAHQVVAQRRLVRANRLRFLEQGLKRGQGVRGDRQFRQHALAQLEDRHIVDVLPNPLPMGAGRAHHVPLILQSAQRRHLGMSCRQLFLKDQRIGDHQRGHLRRRRAPSLGLVAGFAFRRGHPQQIGQAVASAGLPDPDQRHARQLFQQGLSGFGHEVILGHRFLSPAQRIHQRGGRALEPRGFFALRNHAIRQDRRFELVEQVQGGGGAEHAGINDGGGDVGDAALHPSPRIAQHDLPRLRMIGELALDDHAQPPPVEQHVGPLPAAGLNGLGIGPDPEARQQNRQLRVEGFFPVAVGGHVLSQSVRLLVEAEF